MARPSTHCRSSAYREMKLRRFAHELKGDGGSCTDTVVR